MGADGPPDWPTLSREREREIFAASDASALLPLTTGASEGGVERFRIPRAFLCFMPVSVLSTVGACVSSAWSVPSIPRAVLLPPVIYLYQYPRPRPHAYLPLRLRDNQRVCRQRPECQQHANHSIRSLRLLLAQTPGEELCETAYSGIAPDGPSAADCSFPSPPTVPGSPLRDRHTIPTLLCRRKTTSSRCHYLPPKHSTKRVSNPSHRLSAE